MESRSGAPFHPVSLDTVVFCPIPKRDNVETSSLIIILFFKYLEKITVNHKGFTQRAPRRDGPIIRVPRRDGPIIKEHLGGMGQS